MSLLKAFRRPPPRTFGLPAGERVYAIGDVHGRLDLLTRLLDDIERDDAARGGANTTVILLGDLINRGPDSAGVIRSVRQLCEDSGRGCAIKGNHESVFVRAASGDGEAARGLWQMGGLATLMSYGITREEAEHGSFNDLAALLVERIPRADVAFLDAASDMIAKGDYLFVHAGIRPGIPLDHQRERDLRWIREPFLRARRNDGLMVIHGHTPAEDIDEQADRIGIDTGAFASDMLSAIGIEDDQRWFLQAHEPQLERAAG